MHGETVKFTVFGTPFVVHDKPSVGAVFRVGEFPRQ